jgi:HSP20 family protein
MNNKLIRYDRAVPSFFNKDEFLTPFSSWYDEYFNDLLPFDAFDADFFGKGAYPKVDVIDEENQIIINAEIPGLTKEQVSVDLEDGILRIKGEKQQKDEQKNKNYVHRELKHSSFCRSFSIGDNIDKDSVDAKFENGLLRITLKKTVSTPKVEPKKIEIK